ncbi:uncharacterized protein LOC116257619 isoform X3 [Nymphaea colorata]|uniref:uncharacterized protein LOC116257619 isoform X3 n=1 Tax=Nymphaea colorata TaxID=210225 RepID=UPI00214EF96C|nr:uncharacterized protein LOC116257619 isoform X3 [Nymphaea colorata]
MLTSAAPFGVVRCSILRGSEGVAAERGFPSFLPTEVEKIQDRTTRDMAKRIERVPVKTSFSKNYILSSCVKPLQKTEEKPTVLLHGFDSCSSCLEWRYTFPLLEGAGLETWALDVLGWGFSDLEQLPPCDVVSKREHLYQFWRSHIKRPMVLVGPSLGAAIAIDLAVSHPEAVSELVLIDASVYAKGTGWLSKLPRFAAYAGVSILKSLPLRFVVGLGTFNSGSIFSIYDRTIVGSLHCLLPWWEDATVDFMLSGGYNVISQINQVTQKTLIIWGEDDRIISTEFAQRLHQEIANSDFKMIPVCGHSPHVEKPEETARLIGDFVQKKRIGRSSPTYSAPAVALADSPSSTKPSVASASRLKHSRSSSSNIVAGSSSIHGSRLSKFSKLIGSN